MPEQLESNPRTVLLLTRLLWAGSVTGGLLFGALAALVIRADQVHAATAQQAQVLTAVGLIAVLVALGVAIYSRGQILKRGWVGHAVTPQAYLVGTLAALAICEAPVMLTLVLYAIVRSPLLLIPASIGVVGLALLWPNGKAMQPREPGA